jgi:hypothetical protein
MSKFKTGDEIVRTKGDYNWAPLGYKAIVLKGYFYIDALGKSNNEVADDFWELAEDTSKPVYTQEMYDNGELPTVGMRFQCCHEFEGGSRIDDFNGKEVKVIAVSDSLGKKVITFYHSTKGLGCGNFLKSWVHPITPAPIDLIDGNAYMFNINGTWVGFYRESRNCFFTQLVNGNKIASVNECTKIRPMTVAESK